MCDLLRYGEALARIREVTRSVRHHSRRHDARRQDRFEMFGAVAIGVGEIFVGDAAQLPAQFAGDADGVELGALAHDGLDGVDVMRDQFGRHLVEIGRMFDDPAQAFGGGAGGRESECRGIALDVMGGAKQFLAGRVGEAVAENGGMGRREPVGLDRHPVLEFAGQAGKRLFGARHGIVEILFGDPPQHLAQRIGLRDHVMVGEGLDLRASRLFFRHDGSLEPRALDVGSGPCRAAKAAAALPPRRRRGARGRYRRCWCCAGGPGRNRSWS